MSGLPDGPRYDRRQHLRGYLVSRWTCFPAGISGRRRSNHQHFLVAVPRRLEIAVELAALAARDPVEVPAHALLEGLDLRDGRARDGDERDVAAREVDRRAVEVVGPERAVLASHLGIRAEHEVVDHQLAAAIEQVGQRLPPLRAVERVLLGDGLPGEVPARLGQGVARAGELLFLLEEPGAGGDPLFARNDAVSHGVLMVDWLGE